VTSARDFYRSHYADQERGAPGPEFEATFRLRVKAALNAIGASPKRIGCGTGAAANLPAEAGHDVVGVDISESAIRLARQNLPRAKFQVIDSGHKCLS
jgi:methylase of polypeptide subunit release factors